MENKFTSVRPEPIQGVNRKISQPVLIFGYGNLSRGDDALGPLLLQAIESTVNLDNIEILTDFQLQVEHALDLADRNLVLFVDSSVSCAGAFDFIELSPAKDSSYTTHAMSPSAVLSVYQNIKKQEPPPCFLLSIAGTQFELGDDISSNAKANLELANRFVDQLMRQLDVNRWRALITHA
jgi:hydrogenase maturation protease